MSVDTVTAPFNRQQIAAFNKIQNSGLVHGYTCGKDSSHGLLLATSVALTCPKCDYVQFWAHASDVDLTVVDRFLVNSNRYFQRDR